VMSSRFFEKVLNSLRIGWLILGDQNIEGNLSVHNIRSLHKSCHSISRGAEAADVILKSHHFSTFAKKFSNFTFSKLLGRSRYATGYGLLPITDTERRMKP
jgi:hypothetical protein